MARNLCVSGSEVRDASFCGFYRKLRLLPLQLVRVAPCDIYGGITQSLRLR